jgi:importin subunit beta-1
MNFVKYVDHVLPFVYEALNNHAEYQICAAAVGVVGDLSRSLLDKLAPYCDQIMTHLLTCLSVSSSKNKYHLKFFSVFRMINYIARLNLKF